MGARRRPQRRAGDADRAGRVSIGDGRRVPELHRPLRPGRSATSTCATSTAIPTAVSASPACRCRTVRRRRRGPAACSPGSIPCSAPSQPECPRRTRRTGLARRPPRWFDELRPAPARRLCGPGRPTDPTALDDAALAATSTPASSQLAAGLREHFSLVGAASLPVGLYLLRQAERGRSASEATRRPARRGRHLDGRNPARAGRGRRRARRSRAVSSPRRSTTSGGPRRRRPPPSMPTSTTTANASSAGFDVTGRRLVELPDVVLRSHRRRTTAGRPVGAPTNAPPTGSRR